MKIQSRKHIGTGGFWEVSRLCFEEAINVNFKFYKQAIFKKSLENEVINANNKFYNPGIFEKSLDKSENLFRNLANYSLIKESGLPTLEFYSREIVSGEEGILGEDLNSSEKVTFVSPGNANAALAAKEVPSFFRPQKPKILPEAEAFLFDKKIGLIANLDELIEKFYKDMKLTEDNKIILSEESFFFSYSHEKCIVSYLIADFDNIEIDVERTDVYLNNCWQILQSFYLFILIFAEEGSLRENYKRKILEESKKIEKLNSDNI